jgi:hypothetical protein
MCEESENRSPGQALTGEHARPRGHDDIPLHIRRPSVLR